MARKKASGAKTSQQPVQQGPYWLASDAAWGGFLNVRLGEDTKQAFYEFCEACPGFAWQALDDFLAQGGKFGASYDLENQAYVVTLTGALVANSNERYCTTSRAGTFDEALALAMYKHDVLAQGDYSDFMPRTGTFKQWG